MGEEQESSLWDDDNVLNLDRVVGYVGVYICQKLQIIHSKVINLIQCKLYFDLKSELFNKIRSTTTDNSSRLAWHTVSSYQFRN